MKIAILDTETFAKTDELDVFLSLGEVEMYDNTSLHETYDRVKDVDIIVTNKVKLDNELLDSLVRLKLVCITATGTNNIDIDYAASKGVKVKNVAGYASESVAQHTFSMLFHLISRVSYYDEYVKSGKYSQQRAFNYFEGSFWEIKSKVFGIIGLGAIGKRVAELAEAFGCDVVYHSTTGNNTQNKWKHCSLKELLSISDIISINAPLSQNTYDLINKETLTYCKKTAIILNTGRGGIVNESDLANALNQDQLLAAGIDVFEKEPLEANNPLLKLNDPNKIVLTPHNAWTGKDARKLLIDKTVENIKEM